MPMNAVAERAELIDLLELVGARICGRGRAHCPWCKRQRSVSFDGVLGVFHCHGAGCAFSGGIAMLRKQLGAAPARLLRTENVPERRRPEREHVYQQQPRAQKEAEHILGGCKPATEAHPYLRRKSVKPHGIFARYGSLVIPVRAADGVVHSLQFIAADGGKRFLSGGRVGGCCYGIGSLRGRIWLAEGFATGATLHETTADAVAVCFFAGNLGPVAEALSHRYPREELVIAADNDTRTPGNPGKAAAIQAARRFRLRFVSPVFPENSDGTDFNDLAREIGLPALRHELESALPRPALSASQPGDHVREPVGVELEGIPT